MEDTELLKILCCPATGQDLRLATEAEKKALGRMPEDMVLVTADSRRAYISQEGIPILLADSAQTIP